jgi:hypothetical protein
MRYILEIADGNTGFGNFNAGILLHYGNARHICCDIHDIFLRVPIRSRETKSDQFRIKLKLGQVPWMPEVPFFNNGTPGCDDRLRP